MNNDFKKIYQRLQKITMGEQTEIDWLKKLAKKNGSNVIIVETTTKGD